MIQFNKTIFQFTKRFALVVMLMVMAINSYGEIKFVDRPGEYAIVTAKSAKGQVYVSRENSKPVNATPGPAIEGFPFTDTTKVHQRGIQINGTDFSWLPLSGLTILKSQNVYLFTEDVNGLVFCGWWKGDGANAERISSDKDASYTVEIKDQKGFINKADDASDNVTLEAKWLTPQVTKVLCESPLDLGKITDPTIVTETKNAIFEIKDYLDGTSFEHTITPKEFMHDEVNSIFDVPNSNVQGNCTIPIYYKPSGIHNPNIQGSYTLSPKLGTKSQTISLKVAEDYTPSFTAKFNKKDETTEEVLESDLYDFQEVAVGSTAENLAQELMPEKLNYAARAGAPNAEGKGGSIWVAEIQNETPGFEGLFSVTSIENGAPVVKFYADPNNPILQGLEGSQKQEITAELLLTCNYYDNSRAEISSSDITYLKVTVIKTDDVLLEYNPTSYDFGDVSIGETPTSSGIKLNRVNIDEETINFTWRNLTKDGETWNKNIFTYAYRNGNVEIKIVDNDDVTCGSFSAELYVSAESSNGKDLPEEDAKRVLSVTADMSLASPNLKAYPGDQMVHLVWEHVKGADKGYQISYTYVYEEAEYTMQIPTNEGEYIPMSQTSITIDGLNNGTTYTFTLTASSSAGCETPSTTSATATPLVERITYENAPITGIFTGTSIKTTDDGFPYFTKRIVDVSAAFVDNEPIFDRLYIFGLTTGTSTNVTETNAKTPVYIYEKSPSEEDPSQTNKLPGYKLLKSGESASIPEINNISKSALAVISANEFSSIYFTGYCPYATTGGVDDDGVIQISGGANQSINLYLDNLHIYAKAKADNVEKVLTTSDMSKVTSNGGTYYAEGSGAVFAIQSSSNSESNAFRVNLYMRGENTLDAAPGVSTKIDLSVSVVEGGYKDETINHFSSPIHIQPTSNGNQKSTILTISDTWLGDYNHNSAKLELLEKNGHPTAEISINMGNDRSVVYILGGQIYTQKYLAAYIATEINIDTEKYIMYDLDGNNKNESKIIEYNYGGSVNLKDGTFYSNSDPFYSVNNTVVDGGSYTKSIQKPFNTEQIRNSYGDILARFDVEMESKYGSVNEPTNKVDLSGFSLLLDDLFPRAGFIDDNGYSRSLSLYYLQSKSYGKESLCACDNKLYLMLPKLEEEDVKVPWAICAPTYTADIAEGQLSLGGNLQMEYEVDYLLYAEVDDIAREAITQPGYKAAGFAVVSCNDTENYSTITSAKQYTINKKVYLMKPVVAGNWTMFVPPFDVSNVYVVEAYPDAQLRKDYGESIGYGDYIITGDENVRNARYATSQRWMDLYTYWYYYASAGLAEDFNNNESNTIIKSWVNYEKSRDKDGNEVSEENSPYTPTIEQLYHFTGYESTYPEGKNWWDANYYLYKSTDKIWSASKETVDGEEKVTFDTDWEMVTAQSAPRGNKVIMKRGEIYTMQFPATVGTDANDWNYWTGKYIIFEGVGDVQTDGTANTTGGVTVLGSNNINIPTNIEYPNAHLMGNASFANVTVEHENLFYLNGQNFDRANGSVDEGGTPALPSRTLAPMEGFLLANVDETSQTTTPEGQTIETQKIAKSIRMETGEVIYDIKTTIIDNGPGLGSGLPTIMGDVTLIVEPTAEGLTITPLKEQHVMLFDAEGKMIFSKYMSEEESVSLPTGVYVVRGEYEQVKAIKK